jgi:hypothetical protein
MASGAIDVRMGCVRAKVILIERVTISATRPNRVSLVAMGTLKISVHPGEISLVPQGLRIPVAFLAQLARICDSLVPIDFRIKPGQLWIYLLVFSLMAHRTGNAMPIRFRDQWIGDRDAYFILEFKFAGNAIRRRIRMCHRIPIQRRMTMGAEPVRPFAEIIPRGVTTRLKIFLEHGDVGGRDRRYGRAWERRGCYAGDLHRHGGCCGRGILRSTGGHQKTQTNRSGDAPYVPMHLVSPFVYEGQGYACTASG